MAVSLAQSTEPLGWRLLKLHYRSGFIANEYDELDFEFGESMRALLK
ncbi:MAG: hypothetical protein ABF384_12560 [Verrucomicrobiales bacterium]